MNPLELLEQLTTELYAAKRNIEAMNNRIIALEIIAAGTAAPMDWKATAIAMKQAGLDNTAIAARVGKSRQTISVYLNRPEVKERLAK